MKLAVSPPRRTSVLLLLAAGVVAGASLLTRAGPPPDPIAPAVRPIAPIAQPSELSARVASSHLLRGTTETHVAITITPPPALEDLRPPMSLALVIDRSGSMTGVPLERAKAAARKAIAQLAPYDHFAVIAYSTDAETIAPMRQATAEARHLAIEAIGAISADGGTNISQGLTLGATAITAAGHSAGHVILISDGKANEGIHDRSGLVDLAAATAAAGTSITSIGVGLDFDERTMAAIAVSGGGRYYFVEDMTRLPDMIAGELYRLGNTRVTNVELTIEPAPGVDVLEAYGYRLIRQGAAVHVPVNLQGRATVMVRVRATALETGPRSLGAVRLSWRPRGGARTEVAAVAIPVEVTHDPAAVAAHRDLDIVRQVEELETARALEQAAEAYERGDQVQAAGILDQRAARAAAVSAEIGAPELDRKVREVTGKARGAFAAPPGDGADSKRALKMSREDAYHLTY
jgi:Ca-activated chloride channel family protein